MNKLKKFTLVQYAFYVFAIMLIGYAAINKFFISNKSLPPVEKKIIKTDLNEFGFASDSLNKNNYTISPNETFSDLLLEYNIPYTTIDFISRNYKDIFDFRKIIAGKTYRAFTTNDSLNQLKYLVYELNPIDYVVVDLNDTAKVYAGSKKVNTEIKSASGIINNSLYQTMIENKVDPELVIKLSEVFAWQIDFYRVQKGDSFKVIYEEQKVNGKPVGIGKILGAYFNASGEAFYAIDYEQNGDDHYYDENGKSLRKAFLKAPVKFTRISSKYSLRRYHPIEHRIKAHLGTDYVAPTGTPIYSTGDGTIIEAQYKRFNGNYVKIKHNSVYSTQYLHMSRIAKGIHPGVHVKQGQIIGYVGMTGEATGPHVCYRFWKNGSQVDPYRQKIPSAHPVAPKYINDFNLVKDKVIAELDTAKESNEEGTIVNTAMSQNP